MKKFILYIFIILSLINLYLSQSSTKTNLYSKLSEFNSFDLESSFLLNSFVSNTNLHCLSSCTKTPECFYTIFQKNKCFICKRNLTLFMVESSTGNSLIYRKQFKLTEGLINYWTFNGNVNDSIGNANLYGGVNASLTFYRFGIANSALSLANGYYRVPSGVYFKGTEFSIMAWVNVKSLVPYSRLIDFAIEERNEHIVLSLSAHSSGKPYIFLKAGNNAFYDYSSQSLNLNKWQHLACVFSFPYYFIYIDGNLTTAQGSQTTHTSFSLVNVVRTRNFVGRSNWFDNTNLDKDADADFDDLKIFNRALSQQEIQSEMNNNL
jgi:hypothetical protein